MVADVIKVLTDQRGVNYHTTVRIMRYQAENGKPAITLEKRSGFIDRKTGKLKLGHARGFNLTDVKMLISRGAEIIQTMETGEPAMMTPQEAKVIGESMREKPF